MGNLRRVCDSAGKESACNVGDLGSIPGFERSPGEGKGYPLQYSGLENSMYSIVHEFAKSRTWLSDFHFLSFYRAVSKDEEKQRMARSPRTSGWENYYLSQAWRRERREHLPRESCWERTPAGAVGLYGKGHSHPAGLVRRRLGV